MRSEKLEDWMRLKKSMERLIKEDRLIGYLDPGAERYLVRLNKPLLLATTSSCIGRITIIEGKWPWERDGARIVLKTHSPLRSEEVLKALERSPQRPLWLKLTGPIVHFRTPSLSCASWLLRLARLSGFKHSGIISLSRRSHTVEVMSGTQLEVPLFSANEIDEIVKIFNEGLLNGRKRLENLSTRIASEPGPCDAPEAR